MDIDGENLALAKLLAGKMKATARAHARVVPEPVSRECLHVRKDGLYLCLTVDIYTKEWLAKDARRKKVTVTQEIAEGCKYWHLGISVNEYRYMALTPMREDVEFWCHALFEEPPVIDLPEGVTDAESRHFFWKYESEAAK